MADIKPIHHSRQGEKEEKRRKWGREEKLTHYVQPHTVCKYCAFISLCESDHTEKPGKNADFLWYGTLGMHSSLVMCFFDFPCSSVTMHKPSNILILSISHTGQAAPGAWSYFFPSKEVYLYYTVGDVWSRYLCCDTSLCDCSLRVPKHDERSVLQSHRELTRA